MQPQMMQPSTQPVMQPMMMQQGMQPMMQGGYPQQMPQNMMPPNASGAYAQQVPGPSAETGRVQIPGDLKGFAKAKAEWAAMPPIRKVIFGCFPGVLLLVYFMAFDDDAPAPHRTQPQPSSSAMVDASAPAVDAAMVNPIVSNTIVVPPPMMDASVPTITTAQAPLPKGKRTPERDAIDLVSQGQYGKAADIYDQLAQQHPEQPAYKEAARILHLRANGM